MCILNIFILNIFSSMYMWNKKIYVTYLFFMFLFNEYNP